MSDFPDNKDNLFIEETDPINGAWLQRPTDKFFLYSEGYKQAGEVLFKQYTSAKFHGQFLIYPLVFNYRQYIELRLKELITMGYKYLGEENDFRDIHDLKKLWNTYRYDILVKIFKVDSNTLDNVERLITEFNIIDPGSFSFRYPVTRGPNRQTTLSMSTIDLKNFKVIMDKIARFFEYQWDTIDNYQDLKNEHIAEMMSQMYSDNGYY